MQLFFSDVFAKVSYVQCLFLFFFFDVVVAFALVILIVAAYFVASHLLGFVFHLCGGTAAGAAAGIEVLTFFWFAFFILERDSRLLCCRILLTTFLCFYVALVFKIHYCVKNLGLHWFKINDFIVLFFDVSSDCKKLIFDNSLPVYPEVQLCNLKWC